METENSDDQWRDEDIKDIKPSITTVNDDSATVLNDDEDAMTSPPTTQRQRDVVDVVVDAVAENNNSKEAASSSPLDGALLAVAAAIASSSSNRMSISELIRTLTQPEAGLFPLGVAPKDLFEFMCRLPDDQRITKTRNHLQVLLWRDVKLGKICRLGVGLYTVPEFYQDKIGAEPCLTDNDEENNNGKKDGEEQKRKSPLNKKQNNKKIKAALKNVISCFDTSSSFSLSDDIASSNTSTDTADNKSSESNHRNHDDPSTPESRLQSVIEAVSTKMEIWRYVVNETVDEQHQEFKAIKREREENVEKVDLKKKRKKKRRQSDVDVTGAADPISAVSVEPDTFLSQSSHQRGVTDNFQRKAEIGLVSSSTSSTTAFADSSKSKKKVNDFMQIYTKKMKKQSSLDAVSTSSYTGATTTADGESCFFCQMPGTQNIFGEPEAFVRCKDCTFKAHPSCLGYTAELADRCRAYPWQCFECKVCSRCMSSENPELMLMCDSCDRSYHMKCHSPVVESKPPQNDKWICSECLLEFRKKHQQLTPIKNNKKAKNAGNLNDLAVEKRYGQIRDTVNAVSIADLTKETEQLDAQMDKFTLPAIEDNPLIKQAAAEAKVWTVEQVFSFISQLGFPEQANAFKREEIDGQALLLLKRNDVLSMLSLKLGPALKIYRRLAVLQSMACGCDINELEDK